MATQKAQPKKDWLDEAVRHLDVLCQEASEYADEVDVLPTPKGLVAAKQVLKKFRHAHAPKIGLTVNGEFALTWENIGEKFKAYAKPDGSVQFFRDKTPVDEPTFSKYLTAVPA